MLVFPVDELKITLDDKSDSGETLPNTEAVMPPNAKEVPTSSSPTASGLQSFHARKSIMHNTPLG